jgi:hypothetical protein
VWPLIARLLEYLGECLLDLIVPTHARHTELVRGLKVRSGHQLEACMQAQALLATRMMPTHHGAEDAEVGERETGLPHRSRNELPQLHVCLEPCRT